MAALKYYVSKLLNDALKGGRIQKDQFKKLRDKIMTKVGSGCKSPSSQWCPCLYHIRLYIDPCARPGRGSLL